ncbi:MAG: hypothetical protein ACTHJT_06815 [Cytophaga sp.]|uniref:hypothetical protein n=1 Tax=Cytophaga sp. TaxID=29535 RepID=UPI003F7E0D86
MSFNIAGIVINKNYSANIDECIGALNLNISFSEEIAFEQAMESWKDENIYDFYFSEQGTLVLCNIEQCSNPVSITNQQVLTFVISETTMTFMLHLSDNKKLLRSIMQGNNIRFKDVGNILKGEESLSDISEIIWNQIAVILGKKFWDIGPGETCYRYE